MTTIRILCVCIVNYDACAYIVYYYIVCVLCMAIVCAHYVIRVCYDSMCVCIVYNDYSVCVCVCVCVLCKCIMYYDDTVS